jgi:fibronectin-binding autotransporter adhesin
MNMHQLLRNSGLAVMVGLTLALARSASAQINPIGVTGFNENMVVGTGTTFGNSGITATVDGGTAKSGNTWYQLGQDTGAVNTGLPMNVALTMSSNDTTTGVKNTYQMPNVGANNAILLASDGSAPTSGTFTLNQVYDYNTLSLLGADGNGAATVSVTVNYLGGATYATSFGGLDWFTNSSIVYYASGRINSGGYSNVTPGGGAVPALHYYDLTGLPNGFIQSITLSVGSIGSTHPFIFAVSGSSSVLNWTGTASSVWSFAGSDTNWNGTQAYTDFSNAVFNNAGSNAAITIASTVQPSTVTFNNSTVPYSFSGAAISGSGAVLLSNSAGLVTFNNANSYTGLTTITGGTLVLGNAAAVPNSTVSVGPTNGLAFALGTTATTIGALSGGGNFALQGSGANPVILSVGNNNASTTYSGVMSGAGGLTQVGGTQTLSGANTYFGPTTINSGVLNVTGTLGGGAGGGTAITVGPGGILNATGVIAGSSSLAYGASGSSTLSGANTYTGPTTVTAGVLNLTGTIGGGAGGGTAITVSGGTLAEPATGVIAGASSFTYSAGGRATLSGVNTYTGATTISSGTLALAAAGSINSSQTIGIGNGSAFDISAHSGYALLSGQTLTGTGNFSVAGSMTVNAGATVLSAGSGLFRTLNIGGLTLNQGSALNYDIGSGTQDIVNVANGNGLNVQGGGFNLYQGNGAPLTNFGTYTLMNYSGSLSGTVAGLSVLNPVAALDTYTFAAAGGVLTVTVTASTNYWTGTDNATSLNWSDSNNWSALKPPSNGQPLNFVGSVGLSNTNDLVGLQATGVAFAASAGAFNLSGNSIQLSGAIVNGSTATQTIGINIGLSGVNQTINALAGNIVMNGVISDGGAGLGIVKTGAGTVYLTAANTFSGPTIVTAGTLNLQNSLALQSSQVTPGGIVFDQAGSQAFTFGGLVGNTTLPLTDNGGNPVALTIGNNSAPAAYAGVITGSGSLVKVGAGTQTLSGLSTFTGGVTLNGGTLSTNTLSTNAGPSGIGAGTSLTFNGGNLTYTGPSTGGANVTNNATGNNYNITLLSGGGTISTTSGYITLSGALSGSGNLTLTNPSYVFGDEEFFSTATTNASQNFTGNIYITNAAVQLRSSASNLLGNAASVVIGPMGSLSADAGSTSPSLLANPLVLNGGTLATQGVNMNYSGPVTANNGTFSSVGWINNGGNVVTLSGNLQSSGSITTIGGFGVTLSGSNSAFTGTWESTGCATTFTSPNAGSPSAAWVANGQGFTANIPGGGTVSLGALSGGTGTLANTATASTATFSVGALNSNATFSGWITNGGTSAITALTKVGAGNLTLTTGYNDFTGLTTVSGGTLNLGNGASNSTLAGPITNNSVLNFATAGAQNFGGVISGSGSLVMSGTGTLTVTAQQSYTGPTVVTAGTLKLQSNAVTGFGGNGAGFSLNSAGITSAPYPSSNVLQLTDGNGNEARTAFYDWKVPVNAPFTASFVYQAGGNKGADGVAFILQNDPRGVYALGGGGGSFAYGSANPITPSAAVELNLYTGATGGSGTIFATNGAIPGVVSSSPVVLNSGDPILVTLAYTITNGSASLTETLKDQTNGNTYTTTYGTANLGSGLASIVGGTSAYIGFGGATGGVNAIQQVSSFSFTTASSLTSNILPTSTDMSLAAGATLDLYGGSQMLGSLAGGGTVANTNLGTTPKLTTGGDNASQTFSGILSDGSGTLSVVKTGTGIWTLGGNNPYSGGTLISGGTLQIGNGGATGSLGSGSITNNASLSFNRSDTALTINVPIVGSGAVTQNGSGMTTLALNNSYSGGTSITKGALQVGTGGSTGSLGSGPIVNIGQLLLNRSDAFFTLANPISGTGALYQNGGGTVALNGNSSAFTGPITVNVGNLYINSANNTSGITVAGGATLGGTGTANLATATLNDTGNIEAGFRGAGSLTLGGLNFIDTANVNISNIAHYTSVAAVNVTGSNQLTAQGSSSSIVFQLFGAAPTNTVTETAHLLQYVGSIQGGGLSGITTADNLNTANIIGLSPRSQFNLITTDPGYIDLQFSVDYPIWTGAGNGIWTTSPPSQAPNYNWKLASSGTNNTPTDFLVNDAPVFDDSAGAHTTVSLNGAGNVDPVSVTFNNNHANYVLTGSNAIEGPAVLVMNGTGSVTINNANTYYGGTTINAGLLNIGNSAALGSAADYAANGNSFTINGGTIDNTSGGPLATDNYPIALNGSFTFRGSNPLNLGTGAVTLGTSSASVYLSGSTLTIGGAIGDNGLGYGLTQGGAGLLLLTGSSTYLGPTVVNGGTLQVGSGGAGASIGSTSGVALAPNTMLVFDLSDTQTISGSITGSGKMIQMGAGLLTLTNSNSYTGGTTVSGGTLQLSAGGPTGTLATNSTVTVSSGAELLLNAFNALGSSGSATGLTVNSGVVSVNSGFRVPLWNTVNMTGGILTSAAGNGDGNGNYSLSGQVNATSDAAGNPATISATQVSLVTNTVLNISHGSAAAPADLVVSSVISSLPSGNGLTLQGNGFTQFTGANTYNGGTFVSGGTLQLGNTNALGASSGSLGVAPGALVDLNGFSPTVGALSGGGVIDNISSAAAPTLTIGNAAASGTFSGSIRNTSNSLTLVMAGPGTQILSGTNTYSGGTNINGGVLNFAPAALPYNTSPPNITFGGGTLQWAANNTLDVSAGIAPLAAGVSAGVDTNGNSVTFATPLSGTGGLTKAGAGTLTLPVVETYTGFTTITGGTLNLTNAAALQQSNVNVLANNSLTFSGTAAPASAIGGLSGSGSVNLGATVLTVGGNNGNSAYTGGLSGAGSLIKTGTGTLSLAGANTYSGATNITGGILRIAGAPVLSLSVTGGLQYWLDASNPASASGGTITRWNDLSGNGRNFGLPSGGVAPTLLPGSMNGLPTVQFNGATSVLNYNASTLNAQTVIMVLAPLANQEFLPGVWGHYTDDNGIRGGDVNGTWRGQPNYSTSAASDATDANDFATGNGTTYITTPGSFDANTTYFGVGTPHILVATGSASYNNTGLGDYYSGGGRYWGGGMGEVLVYNAVLTTAQRQAIESYLDYKWFGTLAPGGANGVLPTTTPVTISNGGTFDMTNGTQTIAALSSTDGNGSQVLLGSSGVLTIAGSASTTFDGVISGAGGSLVAQGTGTLLFTGANTYTGPTTISAGTLQLGDGAVHNGSLAGNIINNSALVFANPTAVTYAGVISGNGSFIKNGPGTLQLAGSNSTYSGPTLINAGTVQLGPALYPASVVGFGGSGSGWTLNPAGGPPTVVNNLLTLTFNTGNEGRSAFYNSPVAVGGAFTASFVYTDVTKGGADGIAFMLQSDPRGASALGSPGGSLGYTGSATNTSSPNGITPSVGIGLNIYNGAFNNAGPGVYFLSYGTVASTTTTPNYTFFDSGDPIQVILSYDGTGNITATFDDLTLGTSYSLPYPVGNLASIVGTSAYVGFSGGDGGASATQTIGNFNMSYSTLGSHNILPAGTALALANSGTLDLYGGIQTVGSLAGAGTVTNTNPGTVSVLTVGGSSTTTFSGTLQDGGGKLELVLDGPGMLTLSGTNTFSGGTYAELGVLNLASPTALAAGSSLTVGQGASTLFSPASDAPALAAASAGVATVPEPGTLTLFAVAMLVGGLAWRRKAIAIRRFEG